MQFFRPARFHHTLASTLLALLVVVTVSCSPQANSEPTPGPALWKVEGGKADLYLFGTFHILPADQQWLNDTISGAVDAAEVLVTEADTSDDAVLGALVQQYGFNPEGKTLRSYFTEEEVITIDAALQPYGLSVDAAATFKPWLLSVQVSVMAMMQLGYDPTSGVENVLYERAKKQSKPLQYMESGEAGILALADHPDELQAKMLLATVEDLGRMEEMMTSMLEGWANGDIESVVDLMNASMAQTPELIEAVLFKRNRTWVAPLKEMLESDGNYFVAVGAAHLAGPGNVVELLEAEGYTVVRQ